MRPRMIDTLGGLGLLVMTLVSATTHGIAQTDPAVLLLLDRSAIDYGDETHLVPADAANVAIASVGLREPLPFFAARVGETLTIPGGTADSAGWFAVREAPAAWASEPGGADGLENFALAGPGLGFPDEAGDRVALLHDIGGVTSLGATGLGMLTGRRICGVVYADEVAAGAATSLTTPSLGLVAFRITSVDPAATAFGAATVEILDVHETCGGAIVAFAEAPEQN